jgi:hypothetical protein
MQTVRHKKTSHNFRRFYKKAVPPRFELGQAEPKSAVLPLHHGTRTFLFFRGRAKL